VPIRTSLNTSTWANRLRRKYGSAMRLLGCFCMVALATLFGGKTGYGFYFWVSNGVLLAYLLLAPRRLWLRYLAVGFLASLAVSPWMSTDWLHNFFFIPHDVLEIALAAYLLRRRSSDLPVFSNVFYLLRFATCAVVVAPLVTSFVYALIAAFALHTTFAPTFGALFLGDSLGILITTPACVAVFRSKLREPGGEPKDWLVVLPTIAVIALFVSQRAVPCLPLLFPLLIFVLLCLGLGWASLLTLLTAVIGAWSGVHGLGPFAIPQNGHTLGGFRLQIYIVSIMSMLYSVSVVIESLRKTERRLQQIANLHALVAENSRDVIMLLEFEGSQSFISSPSRFWGGWSRDEFLEAGTYALLHPDDRQLLTTTLGDLRTVKDGALIEARIHRKDSTYAWIEASLRTVRDPITHLPTGVLASIREISERKQAEQQLEDALQAVQTLSVTDPLTGLPNRRRFDQALSSEWRRAVREQTPISLLLIDADHFKDYNDTYGHPSGDSCLKQIAESIRCGTIRACDLAARIGGEEFAVLLPNTSGGGARSLANRINDDLRAQAIPHSGNPHKIVTVSIGFATVVPVAGQSSSYLVDLADEALYSAKHAGRNCVFPTTSAVQVELFASASEQVGHA
jgi:diguanylate cyclase (GGDEF)-like protein/PAS domain S-box-containing protein